MAVLWRVVLTDVLGLILLIEGAALLLVGGALGFAGQPGVRRLMSLYKKEKTVDGRESEKLDAATKIRLSDISAAFYMLTGTFLFLESIGMGLLLA